MVLTGGLSRRMGRPKALLAYEGSTFLSVILERLRPLGLGWLGVVTSEELELSLNLPVLVNPDPDRGQLSSLRLALKEVPSSGWLMMVLVDHPGVQVDTYRRLAEAASGPGKLWVPSFGGRRGHPVVFSRACYHDLLHGPLDQGARWVVGRHRDGRVEVAVDDPEIHRDIDTPEDYQNLIAGRIRGTNL